MGMEIALKSTTFIDCKSDIKNAQNSALPMEQNQATKVIIVNLVQPKGKIIFL